VIRVRTGSRLHFGLFSLPSEHAGPWLNQEGEPTLPRRSFGGVGLMVDKPSIAVTVERAATWSVEGPSWERALKFAHSCCHAAHLPDCFKISIESASAEHVGLGSGTQLGIAIARAIAELTGQPSHDAADLARRVGRGLRSSLGIHGFAHGGLLIEGGKTSSSAISPLLVRRDFPEDWRIMLITPKNRIGVHGNGEVDAFASLAKSPPDDRGTESLCRLAVLGMLPALVEGDFDGFGEALYDFNRRAGEIFSSTQGGIYAHPHIEKLVRVIRNANVKGVGQTSWGPTVFAVARGAQAFGLCDWLTRKNHVRHDEIIIANARNRGADVSEY
jgi:beta-RFAP synthase